MMSVLCSVLVQRKRVNQFQQNYVCGHLILGIWIRFLIYYINTKFKIDILSFIKNC